MSPLGCWADSDGDCIRPFQLVSNPFPVIAMLRRQIRPSRGHDVWPGGQLARIPPPLETSELWEPSPGVKINLQVKDGSQAWNNPIMLDSIFIFTLLYQYSPNRMIATKRWRCLPFQAPRNTFEMKHLVLGRERLGTISGCRI